MPWKLTSFYGQPDWTKRKESWALLQHLHDFQPDPWLCYGDFNEIVRLHEKVGGARRKEEHMAEFRSALETCNLSDLGYKGAKFTWNNRQNDGSFIKERLDRVLSNNEWRGLNPNALEQVLPSIVSGHKPLLVMVCKEKEARRFLLRSFKFEASWLLDDDYNIVVQGAWNADAGGSTAVEVAQEKLEMCQTRQKQWSRKKFGLAEKVLKEKTKELDFLQRNEGSDNAEAIKRLLGEIEYIME